MSRALLALLLGVVAAAAAVLSFSALDELGRICGFGGLAWLLPVVLDAGAAAGTLVWLTHNDGPARRFGRGLAVALLASSVAGNAVGHLLVALGTAAPWPLVVAVSAVAPAVLGAVVHLAVLAAQARTAGAELPVDGLDEEARYEEALDERGLSRLWAGAPVVDEDQAAADGESPGVVDRAAELVAAGAGRRRLSRELGVTEHEARRLLAAHRTPAGVVR